MGRLMDIGTDLFAMSAACSYARHLQEKKPEDASPIEMADYFCRLAQNRIDANFYALSHNEDKSINKIAEEVLNQRYLWLEDGVIPLDDQ